METMTFLARGGVSYIIPQLVAFKGEGSIISAIDIQNIKAEMNRLDERVCGEILNQIFELKYLDEDWDSYGGSKISEIAINKAGSFVVMMAQKEVFPRWPIIMPEPAGGVLLKWKNIGNKEFLAWFSSDGLNFSFMKRSGEQREEFQVASLEMLLNAFCEWSKHECGRVNS